MKVTWIGCHSNNYLKGREGKKITSVVCHWMVGTLAGTEVTFKDPDRKGSAHYGISEDIIHQYVKEENTAYANTNYMSNLTSISIEHQGGWLMPDGHSRFKPTEKTHETSALLIAAICKRYDIPVDRKHILKHNEVSDRPTECPGTLDIDWIVNRVKYIMEGGEDMEELERIKKFLQEKNYSFDSVEGAIRALFGSHEALAGKEKEMKLLTEQMILYKRLSENQVTDKKIESEVKPDPFLTVKNLALQVYDLLSKPQSLHKALRRVRNYVLSFTVVNLVYYMFETQGVTNFSGEPFGFTDMINNGVVTRALIAAVITGVSKYVRIKELPNKLKFLKKLFKWV